MKSLSTCSECFLAGEQIMMRRLCKLEKTRGSTFCDVCSNKSTHNKTVHIVKLMQLVAGTLMMQWSEMHMNQTLELWHLLNFLVSLLFHSSLFFRLQLVQFASFYFVSLQNLYCYFFIFEPQWRWKGVRLSTAGHTRVDTNHKKSMIDNFPMFERFVNKRQTKVIIVD